MKIDYNTDKYVVYVDDNFHYMDESERYCAGRFDTPEEAVRVCRRIVDAWLKDLSEQYTTGLYKAYTMYGEDPFIIGPTEVMFSAWDYARQQSKR